MNSLRRFGDSPAAFVLFPVMLLLLASCAKDDGPTGPVPPGEFPIESAFNSDDEGWTIEGDAIPYYFPNGGNPDGHMVGVDETQSGRWYWVAPSGYHGDVSAAYGRSLTFDLYWSAANEGTASPLGPDVILSNGDLTLMYTLPQTPGTTWTQYTVPLHESGGWTHQDSGQVATGAEIEEVLGSLSELRIRGEYRSGSEQGGLDNVEFGL